MLYKLIDVNAPSNNTNRVVDYINVDQILYMCRYKVQDRTSQQHKYVNMYEVALNNNVEIMVSERDYNNIAQFKGGHTNENKKDCVD